MKKFLIGMFWISVMCVVSLAMVSIAGCAEDPILDEGNGCDVTVIVDSIPTEEWVLCITNRTMVGLHRQQDLTGCDQMIPVIYNEIMDLTQYINDCEADEPMPVGVATFGTLKSTYR